MPAKFTLPQWFIISTWRLSVDPVPFDRVVNRTSVSIKPDWSVLCDVVRVINYELLKHVVDVLISDDRQRWIHCRTKLPRFAPTQQRTVSVETIVVIVHWVALGYLGCVGERDSYIACTHIADISLPTTLVDEQTIGCVCLSLSVCLSIDFN